MSSVERIKPGLYKVNGESGMEAGYIQSYKGGWMLHMVSMPKEDFHYLHDAQVEALKRAERY